MRTLADLGWSAYLRAAGSATSMQYAMTGNIADYSFTKPASGGDTLWLRASSSATAGTVLMHRFFANADYKQPRAG